MSLFRTFQEKGRSKHDMYSYNPSYEWTSYRTNFGMVLSYLTVMFIFFYIGMTTRDYITRPPELVSHGDIDLLQVAREIPFAIPRLGIRVSYTNESDPTNQIPVSIDNVNPYVRCQFKHVLMEDQVRIQESVLPMEDCIVSNVHSLCPIIDDEVYKLQGTYYKHHFRYLEISINKCTADSGINKSTCAPFAEINEKIHSGDFRIRAQLSLEGQVFDVERFHATGIGIAINNRSFEYYGLPDIEVQSDVYLKARQIKKQQRFLGSPPLPEEVVNVLTFDSRHTNYRPRSSRESNVISITVRLDDNVDLQEVTYWCPTILHLFSLWGAMTSFIVSLSLGFIARQYNQHNFYKQFDEATRLKRKEACLETQAAMDFVRKESSFGIGRNRDYIYKNLQTQYDALMAEPDIRLFESHHFDKHGRVAMSAAELKFPSTAYGELRRLAMVEHGKKKRAAHFLSLWYGRHLVKKGFIHDAQRRQELFAAPSEFRWKVDTKQVQKGVNLVRQRNRELLKSARQETLRERSLIDTDIP